MLPKPDCWAVGSGSSVVPGHNTMFHLKRKWTTTPRWRARKPHLGYNPWVAMFWVSQHLSSKRKTGSGSRLLYIFEHETSRNSWYSWMFDEILYCHGPKEMIMNIRKLEVNPPFADIPTTSTKCPDETWQDKISNGRGCRGVGPAIQSRWRPKRRHAWPRAHRRSELSSIFASSGDGLQIDPRQSERNIDSKKKTELANDKISRVATLYMTLPWICRSVKKP